jgi:hypothetical protein
MGELYMDALFTNKIFLFVLAVLPAILLMIYIYKKDRLEKEYGARCRVMPFDPIEISSSDVRKMIRENNEDVRLYLPESVYAFLEEKELYSQPLPEEKSPSADYGEYMQLLSKRL